MKLDKETVRHVAEVARLKLSEKEIEEFVPQLKELLDAFSKLDEVKVEGVRSSFQPIELKDAMREDKEGKCLSQKEALSNSPNTKEGYFKGPRAV
ncbi:MAG: Asp-tRNA(Asn)/Glu-tRNA(Gln) amidotransferase subunit GatC [Candidatus Woesearchaeota archaeon]